MGALTVQLRKEHAKLMPHVDELRVIADYGAEIPPGSLRQRLHREHGFLVQEFVPHMEIEQRALYPAMEPILARLGAGGPPPHVHDDVRRLIDLIGELGRGPDPGLGDEWVLEARRALYQLYALLKVHLAEEELYAPLIERELSEPRATEVAALLEFGSPPD